MLISLNSVSPYLSKANHQDSLFKELRCDEIGLWTLNSVLPSEAFRQDPTMQILLPEQIIKDKRVN